MTDRERDMTDIDYEELYRRRPPWEIGGVQPAMTPLVARAKGPRALDVGCGSGELALALARRGLRVTGVDLSATAIGQAREKAAAEGLDVRFEVADAARLSMPGERFDSIFDSGLLHWLVRYDSGAGDYLALLPGLAAPGASVFVLAVDASRAGWGVTERLLRDGFAAPRWAGTTIEPAEAFADVDGESLRHPALLLSTTRAGDGPD
jgi:2-polyprenyl-3-methyl-5-hydroxy-6-metoxy-1,4-benzoquinol methylase